MVEVDEQIAQCSLDPTRDELLSLRQQLKEQTEDLNKARALAEYAQRKAKALRDVVKMKELKEQRDRQLRLYHKKIILGCILAFFGTFVGINFFLSLLRDRQVTKILNAYRVFPGIL